MKVSVIIATYNRAAMLKKCLKALVPQVSAVKGCEIIIVDDGSSDGTADVVKEFDVRYFRQKNKGPAAARNLGVKHAKGDIIAFIDDDCIVLKGWLINIIKDFGRLKDGAAIGSHAIPVYNESLLSILNEYERDKIKLHDYMRFEGMHPGHRLGTDNCAVKKQVFLALHGFDESFKYAGEDPDFWYRLLKKRNIIYVSNDFPVYHHQRVSIRSLIHRYYLFGVADTLNYKQHFKNRFFLDIRFTKISVFCRSFATIRFDIDLFKVVVLSALTLFLTPWIFIALILWSILTRAIATKGIIAGLVKYISELLITATVFAGHLIGSFKNRIIYI